MKQYRQLLGRILEEGNLRGDRTGTGTTSVFGHQMRFDLSDGKLPLLQGKRTPWKSTTHEVLWLISGSTKLKPLLENNVKYWSDWPYATYCKAVESGKETEYTVMTDNDEHEAMSIDAFNEFILSSSIFEAKYGDLGPIYPEQWRAFKGPGGTVDQLQIAIDTIRNNPESRRIIVDAWQPTQLSEMALPPCHMMFQFYVDGDNLSCQIYIRSNDIFLGAPTNMHMYALLTHLVASATGLKAKELVYTVGDAHIYSNHADQVVEYLDRPFERDVEPTVMINNAITNIDDFKFSDIVVNDYAPGKRIAAPVAV